ncbi:AAA family ATPase [Arvimicrobium flavum]|uniref:AAA family ATPase n=1 Tax=Arvimicrobium flavum TaxID=3393320 RepID=UPI00237B7258|nr:AAA family ATPase [Mesorhizobium shangrilense]
MSETAERLEPSEIDSWTAIEFLKALDPVGRHNLVAIDPNTRSVSGRTFEPGTWPDIEKWVEARNGRTNVYFSVNEPRAGAPHDKLKKGDIVAARALHVDLDPRKDADLPSERQRLLSAVSEAAVQPTFAIDSGGGVQAFWKLTQKIPLTDGPGDIEHMNRAAAALLGGGDATQNIERIMRLPGTINMPDAGKRARGRTERRATVLWQDGPVYDRATLVAALPAAPKRTAAANDDDPRVQACIAEIEASDYRAVDFADLPCELVGRFEEFLEQRQLREFWEDHSDPGNEKRFALAGHLKRDGSFDVIDYARLAWIWPRSTSRPDIEEALSPRALARDWVRCWSPPGDDFEAIDLDLDDQIAPDENTSSTSHETTGEVPAPPKPPRFVLETLDDLAKLPKPKWLVEGWVTENSTGILYGKWGSGKSFLAFDLGLHIAYGLPDWHGAEISGPPRKVLVLAREGHQGFVDRAEAFRRRHGIKTITPNFVFMRTPVNFMSAPDFKALEEFIRDYGEKFALVIIDTVARVMAGADMSAPESVTAFMERCDRLAKAAGGTVIGVHHENKSGTMMGSTYFEANADFVFGLTRENADSAPLSEGTIKCTKMKDGPDGWSRSVKFTTVEWEAGGEPRGSLAVDAIQRPGRKGIVSVSKAASVLLDCLERAMENAGSKAVSWTEWQETRCRHGKADWKSGDPLPKNCGDSTLLRLRRELLDSDFAHDHGAGLFATFAIEDEAA